MKDCQISDNITLLADLLELYSYKNKTAILASLDVKKARLIF